jgi:hypothetical protein
LNWYSCQSKFEAQLDNGPRLRSDDANTFIGTGLAIGAYFQIDYDSGCSFLTSPPCWGVVSSRLTASALRSPRDIAEGGHEMGTKTVFHYETRDPSTQYWRPSKRTATQEFLNSIKGTDNQNIGEYGDGS